MRTKCLAKPETQAGRESWEFICLIVGPSLPYGASKSEIKAQAYLAFRVGPDFPQGRIDEAALKRCQWPTYHALVARAKKVGLRLPDGHNGKRNTTEPCGDDGDYIDRLRRAQRLAPPDQREALEWAIMQIEGRYVSGPPIR